MDIDAVVKEALVLVRRSLKERGFLAKGNTFLRRTPAGNTLILAVQRSVQSSDKVVLVTLDYGVYSSRLGARLQDDPSSASDVWQAHWRERLANNGDERWLSLDATVTVEGCAQAFLGAVDEVLPKLLAHSTDEALRDAWLSGSSPNLTKLQRLLYATILVHELGPAERLGEILSALRVLVAGGAQEGLVERRLERAGVRSP